MLKKMTSDYPVLDNKSIDQWRVTELREELRRRKLATKGLKEELVRRLDEAIRNEVEAENEELDDGIDGNSNAQNNTEENEADSAGEDNTDMLVNESKNDDADASMVEINHDISDINQGSEHQNGEEMDVSGLGRLVEKEVTTDTVEDNVSCGQNIISQSVAQVEDSVPIEKHDDLRTFIEESAVIQSEPNNQVSEVNQGLEFQVNYVSDIDSVSLNVKNNIKVNLTADNLPLEIEVVKQEVVPQSSNNYPPTGDDACIIHDDEGAGLKHFSEEQGACENHLLNEQDMGKNLTSDEKEGTKNFGSAEQGDGQNHVFVGQKESKVHVPLEDAGMENDSNADPPKKEDSADGGSPEKLNLDRSSGDESMDEDMSEHKLVETEIKCEEPIDKIEVKYEIDDGASKVALSKFSFSKKDIALEDAKPLVTIEKRKMDGSEAVMENDAPKRQRRWNADTIKVPEQQTPHISFSSTPKSNEQPSFRPTFSRSNSMLSGDSPKERTVPPSRKPPTSSLRIDNFLRPFTLKAVQDLLAKTGKVCDFWMDHIKTHCYVTFSSVEEAAETRNAVYNLQWPPNGRVLVAEYVDPQEVKTRLEAPPQSPAPLSPNPATPKAVPPPRTQAAQPTRQQTLIQQQQQQLPPPPPLGQPPPPPLPNPPTARERAQLQPVTQKKPELPVVTLDDLFKKTRSSPRIYYLPLSEEQVAAKLAAQGKSSTQV